MTIKDQNRWVIDYARTLRSRSGKYPIDPISICLGLGFGVEEADATAGEADIIQDNHQRLIIRISSTLKKRRNPARTRFTIAHELGHALFIERFDRVQNFSTASSYHKLESLCNSFAASLLVDEIFVSDKIAADPTRICETIIELAEFFGVSISVIARIAVQSLGNLCVGLIHVNNCGNPTIKWAVLKFDEMKETQGKFRGLESLAPTEALRWWFNEHLKDDRHVKQASYRLHRDLFLCALDNLPCSGSKSEFQLEIPLF